MAKDESLAKLLERKAKLDARIQAIRSRESAQARKDDARRKVLVGALVLKAIELNPNQKLWVEALLDNSLKRDDERKLFNMPPLAAPGAAPEKAKIAPAAAAPAAPEKAPDKPAQVGPLVYYGFTYSVGGESTAYMPDFQGLGRVTLPTAEKAAQALADKARTHADGLSTRPTPRSLDDARRSAKLDLGSLHKEGLPDLTPFEVEI